MRQPIHPVNSATLFTPITWGLFRFADGNRPLSQRVTMVASYLIKPVDRLVQWTSYPLFELLAHGQKTVNALQKKDYPSFAIRLATTPLWFPLKTAVKSAIFGLNLLRDFVVDDLLNFSGLKERIHKPQAAVQDYFLFRDFEERECKARGENVYHFRQYATKQLKEMELSERAKVVSDMQRRKTERVFAVYGIEQQEN